MTTMMNQEPITNFTLRPIHDRLLRGTADTPVGLYHLHMATAEQLCRLLHYSRGSLKAVKARLKTLVDEGYIQADTIPTKYFRAPYYYTLTHQGMRYLESLGYDVDAAWRASKEIDKHALFVDHTLELNDVLIAAALMHRANPRFHLDSFVHERTLKRHPYKARWQSGASTQTFTVIPDAFLHLRYQFADGRWQRWPVLLEHDRGTEEQRYFRRRIRAYCMLFKTRAYRELFQTRVLSIAFTTFQGEKRRDQMRAWAHAELRATAEPESIGGLFYFSALPRPVPPGELFLGSIWMLPSDQPLPLRPLIGEAAS